MPVRLDYRIIEEYVEPGSRVLDLGCGDGTLLRQLIDDKGCAASGIDIDQQAVQQCVARGVPAYHGDMLEGLSMFAEGRFDCVILSQTLQQTREPHRVVSEMLRVGRRAIISFPNFGHWRCRLQLLLKGRVPVTRVLPSQWYDTPNIRCLTVRDFLDFCREAELQVLDAIYLTPDYGRLPALMANLLASLAIFVLESATPRHD